MEMLKQISTQKELESLINKKNKVSSYIKFTDSFGDINYINIIKRGLKYYYSVCEGYISYNNSKSLNREEIERKKKFEFLLEPFSDGVLYEIDTYPINNKSIRYPVVDIEFLTEDDIIKEIIEYENDSILNMMFKEA